MKVKVIVKVIVQSAPSYPTIFVLNIFLFKKSLYLFVIIYMRRLKSNASQYIYVLVMLR